LKRLTSIFQPQIALGLVEAIDALCPLRQPIQRRTGQIEMACVDHRAHLGEEEGHQECRNMRAVHVRVGHDDDLVIAQVVEVEFCPQSNAQRLREIADFLIAAQF
jgi:hypothetical protein